MKVGIFRLVTIFGSVAIGYLFPTAIFNPIDILAFLLSRYHKKECKI